MSPLRFVLTNQLKCHRQAQKTSGFTLLELLAAMVLAFLVITPLLGFVVNIMETDRKEQAKANSEQELKAALDYITQDLQQAVYIYDADGLTRNNSKTLGSSGIKNQIPPVVTAGVSGCSANSCVPVLVFWKREQRRQVVKVNPSGSSCPPPAASAPGAVSNCNDAYVYSLVGYYLISDNSTGNTWSNSARIARFQISDGVVDPSKPLIAKKPQYFNFSDRSLNKSEGFNAFDLKGIGTLKQKMNKWQKDTAPYNFNLGNNVLVDYIDRPTSTGKPPGEMECYNTLTGGSTDKNLLEQRVPPANVQLNGRPIDNFYACVNSNKNYVRIYLRGNALARIQKTNPPPFSANNSAYFPTVTALVQGNGSLYTRQ
jgi:type II secretory pathway pseudopilin PulG